MVRWHAVCFSRTVCLENIYVKVGCLINLTNSVFVLVMCVHRAKLTLFRMNSSKSIMAVVASPSVSGGEPTSISEFQWSGGVHFVLNCKLDAAWSLQRDFLGLTKWVPDISICTLDDGEPNAVGCLRYCKGSGTTWVHERLLEFDDATRFMSYRMEDNHFVFPQGFQNYVSTVQVRN
jgi:hypothetical protein